SLATCQTGVTIQVDSTPPVLSCPTLPPIKAGPPNCTAVVPPVSVQPADNCTPAAGLTITQDPLAGTMVRPGTTPITVSVSDANGNTSTCTTSLTVTPDSPPVARNDFYRVEADLPLDVPAPGVLANDTDPDGPAALAAFLDIGPEKGVLEAFNT